MSEQSQNPANAKAKAYAKKNMTKSAMREVAAQGDAMAERVNFLTQAFLAMSQKVYELDARLSKAQRELTIASSTARNADYRAHALSNLLSAGSPISKESLLADIERMQIEDFTESSHSDDERRNLEPVAGPAANDMFAIISLKLFKDGTELVDERVVRSKVQLGKNELKLTGLDEAVVGLNVNETKSFDLNLQNKTDKAEVTLLGLRKAKPVEQAQESLSGEQTQQ